MARQVCLALSQLFLISSHIVPFAAAIPSVSIQKRDVVISDNLPVNWTYTGCYTDDTYSPTLSGAWYQNNTAMTQESCIFFCAARGYTKAGSEYTYQCFCGDDEIESHKAAAGDCDLGCSGNNTEACGGSNRLSIFTSNQTSSAPVTNPGFNNGTGNWTLYGCYKEGINGRALTTDMNDIPGGANNVTVTNCVNACAKAGFILAGVELANQCYCGNEFSYYSKPAVDGYKGCQIPCSGNATEVCGGADHLDMYGYNNVVCNPLVSTCTSTTTSNAQSSTTTSTSSSTAPLPAVTTSSTSTTSASSDTSTSSSSSTRTSTSSTSTSSTSTSIYSTTSSSASSSTSSTSTSTSASSISSSTSTSSTSHTSSSSVPQSTTSITSQSSTSTISSTSTSTSAAATPQWYFAGCYNDNVGSRALMNQIYGNADVMTQQLCYQSCAAQGYTLSGTEYYSECYCDTAIRNEMVLASDQTSCNTPCNGNKTQNCGGGDRLSVFKYGIPGAAASSSSTSTTGTVTTSGSAPSSSVSGSGWSLLGCYVDAVGSRTLMNPINGFGSVMTNDLCQSKCKAAGYTLAGTEYSGECYCDTAIRNGGNIAVDGNTYCNMACNGDKTQICGGGNRLSLYSFGASGGSGSGSSSSTASSSTASASAPIQSSGWVSLGCYNDTIGSRTLMNQIFGDGGIMTNPLCQSKCIARGYTISGTEYAGECYCDTTFRNYGQPATSGCNMACNGDSKDFCGGGNRLNVYSYSVYSATSTSMTSSTSSSSTSPPIVTSSTSTTSSSSSTSSTSTSSTSSTSMTTSSSTSSSSTSTSILTSSSSSMSTSSSPTSTSTSSSISSSLSSSSSTSTSSTSSTTTTSSSTSASPTKSIGWYYLGCYFDAGGGQRTLANGIAVAGGGNAMTNEACQAACLANKYSFAGTEYAGECFCDNAFRYNGGPASDGETNCNMGCNGNNTQICGGPNRLSMYGYYSGPQSSSSSTTSSAASTTTAAPLATPTGWNYTGCWIDGANGRIMQNQQADDQKLTVESCITTCSGKGYTVAGMEYGVQCFCDNFIRNGAASTTDSQCSMNCAGNSAQKCGNGGRMSIYSFGTLQVYVPPITQNATLPGNWTYAGCLSDDADRRSLAYRITNMVNNNTATNCLSLCSAFGYPAGGMEFSTECYCGDFTDVTNAGGTFRPESECNMACSGNSSTLCGGPSRISYYTWTASELYHWERPTGIAAGQYKFLIGGVTIPLITSLAINGKVTYLEKFGTSPANNGTGAYELDLAQLGNFTGAWRPMHVKTDIFCAAGLTLPDKAGRQLNVGGWANDATYGLRLYWPDGSPGNWGKNDWQENVEMVGMQNGRWYPTAMIMSNGSILVVGGQQGSNGAPVPTLEILPKVGPVKYCDWLERTDPNNLYPYLSVLPTGGIFVAYYNEARILDEVTLDTQRTLPNIPAAVNDFNGGRTYPFEGTSVLLPQHAPYTDPLVFMVCGGSTPGPEIALDNCVSITPEVANANWTIERMPSARVISCMTALPDGTFLILNGGQQGRAGFGLAVRPNHNAVLYDPSKPVNRRMSVMANTTVDRLYHSEAILLQDGSVLVSGSDPEDERFLQEYRNELFLPPYLLNGTPAPVIKVPVTDWAYGASYDVQIVSSTGSGNYKMSLMALDSSTHGNSMGQRTIFPAFTCSGGTCRVTAPPNAHVCPPGWHQLFFLENGTPSFSVFVRIGGDPGNLGKWPDVPDFYPLPGNVLGP